jgi:predicted component of type VI protein secretion system
MAVVGGFSGASGAADVREVGTRHVDWDGFDTALRSFAPVAALDLPFCRSVRLRSWEAFGPDGLCEAIPALGKLLEARSQVGSPGAMQRALAQAGVELTTPEGGRAPSREPEPIPTADGDLLDSMLGGSGKSAGASAGSGRGRSAATPVGTVDDAIRRIVESSGDDTDYAAQEAIREAVDAELGRRVRAILRNRRFRRLEATWGGLRGLVRAAESGEDLRVRLLDHAQEAFLAELHRADTVKETALYAALADLSDGGPGGAGVDLLVTDYAFDLEPTGLVGLRGLIDLCEATGTRGVARAAGRATRIEDATEEQLGAWLALRSRPGAERVGLCAPRLLLRPPHGPETAPSERFAFDEEASVEEPASYAWSSAAFGLAHAVVRAHAADGDLARLADFTELEDLPIHVYRAGGEVQYQGPTEEFLTERRLEAYEAMGLVPVTAVRGRDAARILSLRSLAGSPLLGNH